MNKKHSEKLKTLINKGKWPYVVKHGVLGWGVSTAILWAVLMRVMGGTPFTDSIFFALVIFPIGGFFWGLFMWHYLSRELRKMEQSEPE